MDSSLAAQISTLQQRPKCEGWGSRVQSLCETIWTALDRSDVTITNAVLNAFCTLLRAEDSFQLARLVIPELRTSGTTQDAGEQKRYVLVELEQLRTTFAGRDGTSPESFYDDYYREEKNIYMDSELYRARIFLHQRGLLEPASMEEIRQWLDSRPGSSLGK